MMTIQNVINKEYTNERNVIQVLKFNTFIVSLIITVDWKQK